MITRKTPRKNRGVFAFTGSTVGNPLAGALLGKKGSGILTRLTGNARELLPAGAPRKIRGVFVFPESAAGNPLAWGLCWENGALAY